MTRRTTQDLLALLLVLILGAGAFFVFREDVSRAWRTVERSWWPCRTPIYYSIGTFDEQFGLLRADFESAVEEAAATWSAATGQLVLAPADDGALKVNLIYDYRQATTEVLQEMGVVIEGDQATYDDLSDRYQQLKATFDQEQVDFKAAGQAMEARREALEAEVNKWNARGGASPKVYDRLMAEQTSINQEISRLNARSRELNRLAGQINAIVEALNQLAKDLNLQAGEYNEVVRARGEEFEAGHYCQMGPVEAINIYEFENRTQLVRVLMHEFGHALGLEHSENPADVMYWLNEGQNASLSAGDVQAITEQCESAVSWSSLKINFANFSQKIFN